MQARTVILLKDAGDYVFEILAELRQRFQDQLDYLLTPLASLVTLERGVLVNEHLADSVLRDLLDLFGVEISVIFKLLCHLC